MTLGSLLKRLTGRTGDNIFDLILRGGAMSFVIRIAGIGFGVLSHIMLSRFMGASSYGLYAIAIGWCMILAVPSKFGLEYTVLKYASHYIEEGDRKALGRIIRFSFVFPAILLFLVGVGLAGVFVVKPDLLGISNLPSLQFSILLIGTLVYLAIFSAYFRAAKRIFASQFYMQVLRTILLMSGLAAILLLGNELELTQAIAVTALSALVALIFLLIHFYFMMKKVMPTKTTALNKPRSMDTERDWLHLGGPVFLIAIVQQLTSQGNIILIGNLIGSDAAGQYAAAFRLANFIPFALLAIGAIAAPMIATAYRREDKKELQRIATISARIAFLAGAGLGGVFVLFGKPILLLFGPDFVPAYGALIVLSIANIVNAGTGVAGYYLLMTGHQMQALYFGVFCLLLNVTLALVLIPQMGLLGGATAAAIGLAAFNVLQYMFVRKKMGIDSSVFGGSKSEKQI